MVEGGGHGSILLGLVRMTTEYRVVKNDVRTAFVAALAGSGNSAVPVIYDNDPTVIDEDHEALWIRMNIRFAASRQVTMPFGWRTWGSIIAQLFERIGLGESSVMGLADDIVEAFKTVTIDGIVYRVPRVETIGRDATWWQVNVICPFYVTLG